MQTGRHYFFRTYMLWNRTKIFTIGAIFILIGKWYTHLASDHKHSRQSGVAYWKYVYVHRFYGMDVYQCENERLDQIFAIRSGSGANSNLRSVWTICPIFFFVTVALVNPIQWNGLLFDIFNSYVYCCIYLYRTYTSKIMKLL